MAKLKDYYTKFALSFRQWHYRTTPEFMALHTSCEVLSISQGMALFFIVMPFLIGSPIPVWAVIIFCALSVLIFYIFNYKIYKAHEPPNSYAKLSDKVPSFREFPGVYIYFIILLAMFTSSLYVTIQIKTS